jgi:uncharacterized protein involved in outer membrane biogenesis
VALVVAMLVSPSFVDWNDYRRLLAAQLSAALDREVTIAGDMDAALLPRPVFTASDIRIGDPASDELISIEALDARLAFMPLLTGRAQLRELVLLRPVAIWSGDGIDLFSLLSAAETESPSSADEHNEGEARLALAVDFVEIQDGIVEYRDSARGQVWRGTRIDAEVSIAPRGPIRAVGTFNVQGTPLSVEATMTPVNAANADGINISVGLVEADLAARFIGSVNRTSERDFRGDFSVSGNSGSALLATFGLVGMQTRLPAALLQPFSLSAKVKGTSENIETDSLSVDIGGTGASGTVSWTGGAVPHLEVALDFSAVDVATWKFASASNENLRQATGMTYPDFVSRAYAAEASDEKIIAPRWLTASVRIRAPLLSYDEEVLQDGIFDASLSDGELAVRNFGVTLPGPARVKAFGFIRDYGASPVFDGALEIDTQNLRGTLSWLGASEAINRVPRGRLSNASMRAALQGTPARLSFGDVKLVLDTSSATGSAFIARGERTSLGVDLTIDNLNLDTYVPVLMDKGLRALFSGGSRTEETEPGVYGVTPILNSLKSLANVDADVRIGVDALTAGNVPNGRVGLDFDLKGGVLNILSASFDNIAGATLWFSGELEGFGTTPQFRNFQFDLHADDFGRFSRAFGISVPASMRNLAPVALTGVVSGGLTQADLDTTAKVGDMTVNANGRALSLDQQPQLDLSIEANHPSYAALMRDSFGRWPAGTPDPGAVMLTTQYSLMNTVTSIEELKLVIGSESIVGRVVINEVVGRKKVSANIEEIALIVGNLWPNDPAQRFLAGSRVTPSAKKGASTSGMWSEEPFDWSFLGAWDGEVTLSGSHLDMSGVDLRDFECSIIVDNGAAEISHWSGYLFGAQGQLSLRATTSPELALQGEISFAGGDFASVAKAINGGGTTGLKPNAGEVDFSGHFEASGSAPRSMIENLSGSGTLKITAASAGTGVVAGLLGALSAVSQVESIVPGGNNAPMTVEAKLSADKGRFEITDGAIKSRSYGGMFTGTVDLPNWLIDVMGRLRLEKLPRADAATQRTLPTSVPITVRGRLDLPNIILNPA